MSTPVSALIQEYDAAVTASSCKHGSKAFRKWQRRYLIDEMEAIFDLEESGDNTTMLWVQFDELMEARALPQIKGEYRRRKREWEGIPSRADIAVERFSKYMGDETKLENWQKLCRDLSFEVIPPSITQCKKALKRVYINIYTFLSQVEAGRPEPPIDRFKDFEGLRRWSKEKKMIFPLYKAKKEGALRGLLQPILKGRYLRDYVRY